MARPSSRRLGARACAAQIVAAVQVGRSLDAELAQPRDLSTVDQRFVQALTYGVLRDWRLLQWLAGQMLRRPPKKSAQLLEALLAVGLFQLRSMAQPEAAVVHSTVQAARELRLDWAAGLLNAVLRRYLREGTEIETGLPADPGIRQSHPDWLIKAISDDWPQSWAALLRANQQPGPMWLRVNRQQHSRQAYLAQLQMAGIQAVGAEHAPDALQLAQPLPVSELPGFSSGAVSVQDAAAQLAAPLLDCQAGQRVLDACAAPGGKTGHLLECAPDCELLALDNDAQRLTRVAENLGRLRLSARLCPGDAGQIEDWWDGRAFDRILLDAPCSGTGVIRRHPDIKWLRRPDDIARMQASQRALLAALWPTLAAGGQLLFSTCSILRAEGDGVIEGFIDQLADAAPLPLDVAWGEATDHGRRIATGQDGMDGFYYCLLTKRSDVVA